MRKKLFSVLIVMTISWICGIALQAKDLSPVSKETQKKVVSELKEKFGKEELFRIERGVERVATLWRDRDGSEKDFQRFCLENFVVDDGQDQMFSKLSRNLEVLWGKYHEMEVLLKEPLHLSGPPITKTDMIFGGYNPSAHLTEDLYLNKAAFLVGLNFPFYSLDGKAENAGKWSRKEWAYARMGDLFTSRLPAALNQEISSTLTEADTYISEYNIYMGMLQNMKGEKPFPEDLKLISHWGLRDELKSQYANKENGLENQDLIYTVMKRIIDQTIPKVVINKDDLFWNPYTNKVSRGESAFEAKREPDTRYATLLKNFRVMQKADEYYPNYDNYIQRKFEHDYEISQQEVEQLFVDFVSSPVIRRAGKLIEERLGRDLKPWDIWYDGFKARSNISEAELDAIVEEKYPNPKALEEDLPRMLIELGFAEDKANDIASKIVVDPARGAGHAWGAEMRSDVAHLRTRISEDGADYKGYNIAVHEFGHNVEQTISLYDVDYYMLNGVPNTAFTEALAFIFQKRDLELLGMDETNPDKVHLSALDNLWPSYEIMGVSLVDMRVWKWMYNNPEATPKELKQAVIRIAKEVWNSYFADVFGEKDQPILAIYSHMIDNPLYLSAYPLGLLIDFQLEEQLEENDFAEEVQRIYKLGRVTPQHWMKQALGNKLSIQPTLQAAEKAINALKEE